MGGQDLGGGKDWDPQSSSCELVEVVVGGTMAARRYRAAALALAGGNSSPILPLTPSSSPYLMANHSCALDKQSEIFFA